VRLTRHDLITGLADALLALSEHPDDNIPRFQRYEEGPA
jgi:hypothetical protein